ncbi:hypothetical protein NHQ30_001971 [Ciborinia camelliae]|nr:hypothetical protein NHQ30_001971 [Ciborinia camelliae]
MTKSKSKPEPTLQDPLKEQTSKAQDKNATVQTGKGKCKGKANAPEIVQKDPRSPKKEVTIDTIQTKLSSLISESSTHSNSSITAKTAMPEVGRNLKNKLSQVSQGLKQNHSKGERRIQRVRVAISPNLESMSSKEKDGMPSSAVPAKPKPLPTKGKEKRPEKIHQTPISIPPLNTAKSIPITTLHKPSKQSRSTSEPLITPSTSKTSVQPISKSAPASPSQTKKHLTLSSHLVPVPAPAQTSALNLVPVKPKLLKRFYEVLVLLTVFGKNRGDHTSEEDFPSDPAHDDEPSDLQLDFISSPVSQGYIHNMKLRRSFARHLAYLCDYEKGGDSTTAIALQQLDTGEIVYHVAWNKDSKSSRSVEFLEGVLGLLGSMGNMATEGEKEDTRERIFELSIKHTDKRILFYASSLAKDTDFVLRKWNIQDDQDEDSSSNLEIWLRQLLDLTKSPFQLCRFCHEICTAAPEEFAYLQHLMKSAVQLATRFKQIHHTIGRLNHTIKAIKVLISTSTTLPQLFRTITISLTNSSTRFPPPLVERNPTLFEIIGRTMCDIATIDSYREALAEMDHKYQLSRNLSSHCLDNNWRPKVHAELLLLQTFHTRNLKFVDNDKYIACSKPACYCCYHYIKAHPGKFVVPGSHHNNYLNWRAPDVEVGDDKGESIRMHILIEMSKIFRGEVLHQIWEMRGPRKWKPDSMTEISSARGVGAWGVRGLNEEGLDDASLPAGETSGEEENEVEGDYGSLAGDYDSKEEEAEEENVSSESVQIAEEKRQILNPREDDIDGRDYENSSEDDEGGVSLVF